MGKLSLPAHGVVEQCGRVMMFNPPDRWLQGDIDLMDDNRTLSCRV